jgi:hypothetical protein
MSIAISAGLNGMAQEIKAVAGPWPSDALNDRLNLLRIAAAALSNQDKIIAELRRKLAATAAP